jgi:hypothetical protein
MRVRCADGVWLMGDFWRGVGMGWGGKGRGYFAVGR